MNFCEEYMNSKIFNLIFTSANVVSGIGEGKQALISLTSYLDTSSLRRLPRPDLLQRLVAQRSLLPPPREDIHTAPFLSAVRPLAFLCVMAQRLCVSAVKTKTPGFPYHSATHTVGQGSALAQRLSVSAGENHPPNVS